MNEFEKECVKTLQELIRIPTINSNEIKAVRLIQKKLKKEKIKSEIITPEKGRASILITIKGRNPKAKSILLLSHLDVVEAKQENWKEKPFAGIIKKGFIWGRGAIDCKGLVTAQLMAIIKLKREGYQPTGDIKALFTADEESGGKLGAGYLTRKHFNKIKTSVVINEGGGPKINNKYLIQFAEKGNNIIKLIIKGTSTHGSTPQLGDNALIKASKIITKIRKYKPKETINEYLKVTIKNLGLTRVKERLLQNKQLFKRTLKNKKEIASLLLPSLSMTITPTKLETINENINVIPDKCELTLDCRLLPNQTIEQLTKILNKIIGKELIKDVEIKYLKTNKGNASKVNTTHYDKIRKAINKIDPESELLPFMTGYCTDSKYFREKGITCYGFMPFKESKEQTITEAMKTIHGPNERISIKNLIHSTKFFYELLKSY